MYVPRKLRIENIGEYGEQALPQLGRQGRIELHPSLLDMQ